MGQPYIFIFTSVEGERHGYKDEYREDGIFLYTGEGQVGDMKMQSGNKAILEHAANSKAIHVFEQSKRAHVRYLGTAECLGYHEQYMLDKEGKRRKAYRFHLAVDSTPAEERGSSACVTKELGVSKNVLKKMSLMQLREAAVKRGAVASTAKEKRDLVYYRSEALKLYVTVRSRGRCEGCGDDAPFRTKDGPYLECHHIYRLADGGPDHPRNVVALCPNCHRRAHYAVDSNSFNDSLRVVALAAEGAED